MCVYFNSKTDSVRGYTQLRYRTNEKGSQGNTNENWYRASAPIIRVE